MKRIDTQVCLDAVRGVRPWAPGAEHRTRSKFRVGLFDRLGGFQPSALVTMRWFITAMIDERRHAG